MNQSEAGERAKEHREAETGTYSVSPIAHSESDDPRVIQALDEYTAALRDGRKPSREEFQARYPDIAAALGECLEGLEFIQEAAPRLHESAGERPTGVSAATEDAEPHGSLGDFNILREIGRGGMGIVYEAEQISLGRRVAIKVLPFAAALDPKQLQRFKNEAQAAAHLHHTNIVPVYAVGCERGVHYYAMQYIEGQTLAPDHAWRGPVSRLPGTGCGGHADAAQTVEARPAGRARVPCHGAVPVGSEGAGAGHSEPSAAGYPGTALEQGRGNARLRARGRGFDSVPIAGRGKYS
jgi:hypothetical protein